MKTSAYLNRVDGPAILTDVPVDRPERVDAVVGDKPFATPVLENPAPERLDPASLISRGRGERGTDWAADAAASADEVF